MAFRNSALLTCLLMASTAGFVSGQLGPAGARGPKGIYANFLLNDKVSLAEAAAYPSGSSAYPNPAADAVLVKYFTTLLDNPAISGLAPQIPWYLLNPNDPGFYAINAQLCDALDLTATATSPLGSPDELLLYDPNGNLVAVAAGNAPDGVSSAIQFTLPQGDPGNWVAEVAGSPNVNPNTNLFDYDLNIKGATGAGPISPLPLASAPEPKYAPLVGFLLALGAVVHRRRVSVGR